MTPQDRARQQFLGVSEAELIALGKVAVAAGRVESAAVDIAWDLKIERPARMQLSRLAKKTRALLRDEGVPAFARTTPEKIVNWLERVLTAMDQRNAAFHSAAALRAEDGRLQPVRRHIRSDSASGVSADGFEQLAERLRNLSNEGSELDAALAHEPRPGVCVRRPGHGSWIILRRADDGSYPIRPTERELDEWWVKYQPGWGPPPPDLASWSKRH